MNKNEKLLKQTRLLLVDVENTLKRFEQSKTTGEKGEFFTEVKPFADEVKHKAEIWRDGAIAWLNVFPQHHLHSQQIISTVENLEMVSVQAFFPETSRKRFMGYIQSIEYVLKGLKEVVEEGINDPN
jgi:hypothetical protein